MFKWLYDRTLAPNRHPSYPVGLIIGTPSEVIHTITNRRWSNSLRTWEYHVDSVGWMPHRDVTYYIKNCGVVGAV